MRILLPSLSLLLAAQVLGQQPRFVKYPDVRAERVVFTWDGDLWSTSLQGGPALRLTSHPGQETHGRISPDGKWIAFSGSYDGGQQVYVMPVEGGAPRRLTWRGSCRVQGWSPDGQKILFESAQENKARPVSRLYTVDLQGHEPEALPMIRASAGSFVSAHQVAFSSKGSEEYYWKRYRGGQVPDLWLADLQAGTYTKLSQDATLHAAAMGFGSDLIFLSDRGPKGIRNLVRTDRKGQGAQALTDYQDFDVQWPATDGKTVVFSQAGYLTALDPATQKTWRVAVTVANDDWKRRPTSVGASTWMLSQSLAKDGKSVAIEARGDVFLVDAEGKKASRNLTQTSGVRERLPELSPDGTQLAYVSDASGDYDLYVRPVEGGTATRIPTGVKGLFSRLRWSPDGRKLLFSDQAFTLFVVDVAARKVSKLTHSNVLQNDQFTWEQADYTWAPDSTWVAYSQQEENRHGRIWLHNTATGQRVPVTNGFHASLNPCFDSEGGALYFLSRSHRHVVLDATQDNYILDAPMQVMKVLLKAKDEAGAFRIDAEGLDRRVSALPIKPGNLFHLKAGKGLLVWHSAEHFDEPAHEEVFKPKGADKWQLRFFDLGKQQEGALEGTLSDTDISPDGGTLMVRKGQALHVGAAAGVLASKQLPAKLDLTGLQAPVVPVDEWTQVWADTYRFYRDFFYDAGMHGQDWKAVAEKFKAWIPDCPSRRDLNWLLSQMVGELCVGHTYVGGGDFGSTPMPRTPTYTGLLGADFTAANGRHQFSRIYGPTPYQPGLKAPLFDGRPLVQEGEYLLAIDGVPLAAPEAIHKHLQVTRGQKVRLTVNTKPTLEGARTVEVEPRDWDGDLRFEGWIARNIEMVERRSKGTLGYIHTTAMGEQNLGQFDTFWSAFKFRKGLVVDVRGNGGGWTEYFMIDKLERKQVGFNVLRGMAPFRYPNTASDGRYVFLSNEENGSDGEAFLAHAKARSLGTLVGTRSWGGLVGIINEQPTIDGGSIFQPNNAFYGKEGAWWIENEGAVPDVEVDDGPDPKDADRQITTAVDLLMKQLQDQPTPTFPPRPAYPKR